jgi:hypothetical protein
MYWRLNATVHRPPKGGKGFVYFLNDAVANGLVSNDTIALVHFQLGRLKLRFDKHHQIAIAGDASRKSLTN